MKKASQRFAGTLADTGAKTMLKTDMMFLEKDIKARKHEFGVQVFDILQKNAEGSATAAATISAADIQKAFEECQADILHLEGKVETKKREMENINQSGGGAGGAATGGSGANAGMDEPEAPGIPSTP